MNAKPKTKPKPSKADLDNFASRLLLRNSALLLRIDMLELALSSANEYALKFISKVDRGLAKSKETYADMKSLTEMYRQVMRGKEGQDE
jgi:hypothetical protein